MIAVDGPSASGKSTVSRRVAAELGWLYVDSGSFYRGVTWKLLREGVPADDSARILQVLRGLNMALFLHEGAVEFEIDGVRPGADLRAPAVRERVSPVSAIPEVRAFVTARLRETARFGPIVMEGRDIGSVVFPDALFKFYLDASAEERAKRRHGDLLARREQAEVGRVLESLQSRDRRDSTRATAPLKVAPGAQVIDSTALSVEEVVRRIVTAVRGVGGKG
ncbi:MAG: (d)CMP kinase [Planctomycetes bacterium]|nr:(d)CMP kinase [Planctomycetota bacterium]